MRKDNIMMIVIVGGVVLFLMYIGVWGQRGGIISQAQVDVVMWPDDTPGESKIVRAKTDVYIEGRDLISNYREYSLSELRNKDGTWITVNAPCIVQERGTTDCVVDNDLYARFELSDKPDFQQ